MTRRERIAQERAAEQSQAATNGQQPKPPAQPPTRPAEQPRQSRGSAPAQASQPPQDTTAPNTASSNTVSLNSAAADTESSQTAERPVIRPAQSNAGHGIGSAGRGYGSGHGYGTAGRGLGTPPAGAAQPGATSEPPAGQRYFPTPDRSAATGQHPYTFATGTPGHPGAAPAHSGAAGSAGKVPGASGAAGSLAAPAAATGAHLGGGAGSGDTGNGGAGAGRRREYEPLGPVRGTIRGFGELCITAGLVLILFVVWQLWWTDFAADNDNRKLADQLTTQWKDNPKDKLPKDPSTPAVAKAPPNEQAFGIVYVPRFGDDYYRTLAEGVSLDPVLNNMGIGHYPSTAMPGEVGNFAVAGHRVTYGKPFNQIAEMRPGDKIIVQTADGYYTYTFRNFDIVLPDDTDVLAPVPAFPKYKGKDRIMTMTACNPMFSARERYIAYSELTDWRPASKGAPADIKDSPAYQHAGGN